MCLLNTNSINLESSPTWIAAPLYFTQNTSPLDYLSALSELKTTGGLNLVLAPLRKMNSNKDNHEDERKIAASSDSDLVNSSADDEDDSKYQYRDFSRVQPDEGESVLDVIAHMPSSTGTGPGNSGMGSSAHAIKHQKLPIKLNAMLSDKELAHIISWMPHGRSWRILKPKQFVKEVLPKYFDYCNYNSFIRLVNAWGFRRFSSGPDRHSYYHEVSKFIILQCSL